MWKSIENQFFVFILVSKSWSSKNGNLCYYFWIISGMQSHCWLLLQFSFVPSRSQSKGFCFWGRWVETIFLSVSCDWLLIVEKSQEAIFSMVSSRFSKADFLITINLKSTSKISIWYFLLRLEKFIQKSLNLYPFVESWWTRVARRCFQSWHTSVFKPTLLQLCLFNFFHQGVSLDSFVVEADCLFLCILKYDPFIGIGIF